MNKKEVLKQEEEVRRNSQTKDILERFNKLKPTKKEFEEYKASLEELKPLEINFLHGKAEKAWKRASFRCKVASLNKKKAILITMLNKNGTISHYIISKYSRTFEIDKKEYILDDKNYYYNTTYLSRNYIYLEDIPVPLNIDSNKKELMTNIDAQALKSTIKMEYVERLTKAARLKDLMKIVLAGIFIVGILTMINLLINAKSSGLF